MGLKYYVMDLETTGLNSAYHEITEISIIRADDRMQLTRMVRCDYPERANLDALLITKKTLADLAIGDEKGAVVERIDRFLNEDGLEPNGRCFIGHNVISFDKKFIHALYEGLGRECPVSFWLDTIHLTQSFLKTADLSTLQIKKTATGKPSKKLQDACDMLGIEKIAEAHASKADTRNTYLLWRKLMDIGIDHLPHIKSFPHCLKEDEDLIDFDQTDLEST
jgi:DNA polymerase III epsilon subunit-like protein